MKSIKQIPLSLKISAFITIAISTLWIYTYNTGLNKRYIKQQTKHRNQIITAIKYSEQILETNKDIHLAVEDLDRRIKSKDIRFYMLLKGSKLIHSQHSNRSVELKLLRDNIVNDSFRSFKDSFYAVKKFGTLKLYVGTHISEQNMVENGIKNTAIEFIIDISFVFLISFFLIELFVKHVILSLLLRFQSTKRSGIIMNALMSKELEMVANGIDGFHEDYELLRESYKIVEEQIPEAIRTALLNKRKNFEKIKCTMVSTDINNSSSIQDQFPSEVYIPIFQEVMNIITRTVKSYGGNSYKFVGDEIIYYFNENDNGDSVTQAMSAVKDINHEINKLAAKQYKDTGFRITTKSAMAYGSITFTLVDSIFEIMGGCITEATRILSQVEDKTVNSLYVNEDIKKRSDQIIRYKSLGKFKLKGLEGERELFSYLSHDTLESILEQLDLKNAKKLIYYRRPTDIIKTLDYLKINITTIPEALFIKIIGNWNDFPSVYRGETFREEVISFLKFINKTAVQKSNDTKYRYYLSYSISLIHNLISNDLFNDDLSDFLLNLITTKHSQRAIANAVEVLGNFDYKDPDKIFIQLLKHDNNRVRSNAIVAEGINDFDTKVFKRLKKLLRSKEKLYIASGIYAARVIITHHKQNKRVYNVNMLFKKILKELYRHINDENEMIRRQLSSASNELNDELLLPKKP